MRKRDLIIEFLQLIWRKKKKAAPRFELGIKDLQSSALPLGHAADLSKNFTIADSISNENQTLLVISNGHGEDLIALRIIEALHDQRPDLKIEVLPLVGEGNAFNNLISQEWLNKIGPSLALPSGGFSNQSLRGLIADIFAGVFQVAWKHWVYVRSASSKGRVILAIGDLLPLFFAWCSGTSFSFIGTPKSDYTWTTSYGMLLSDYYHRLKRTEWEYWEWCLMRSKRCKIVGVRDKLTARGLRRKGVEALAFGNPMMDGFKKISCPTEYKTKSRILLLCGSRTPEAFDNFRRLMKAVLEIRSNRTVVVFVALGSETTLNDIEDILIELGFAKSIDDLIKAESFWTRGIYHLFIGIGRFDEWTSLAEVGLANAGTATEQLVGCGVPCVSLPGKGPQFTKSFAIRQSRLLGGAVIPCNNPKQLALRVEFLFRNNQFRKKLSILGSRRMGVSGGSIAIASNVLESLIDS